MSIEPRREVVEHRFRWLDDFALNHVQAIVEKSGWNRAEVLYALVQRGLCDLYEFASPETIDLMVQKLVQKVAPSQPSVIREE
jgi:hypothetical protein